MGKARGGQRPQQPAKQPPAKQRSWATRFLLGVLLWLAPVIAVWVLATPVYNLFLTKATENVVRMTEDPSVTRLQPRDRHYMVVTRTDFPTSRGALYSVRVTDTHFPLILMGAFFLAVPGVGWKRRFGSLGWAALLSVFFHILLLFCWVKFVYATQLDSWSAENYSAFGRNFWGLSKHLLDLPFRLAMPLLLWAAFFLKELIPRRG